MHKNLLTVIMSIIKLIERIFMQILKNKRFFQRNKQCFPQILIENASEVTFLGSGLHSEVYSFNDEVWIRSSNNILESIANFCDTDYYIHVPKIRKTIYRSHDYQWYNSELLFPLSKNNKKIVKRVFNYIKDNAAFHYHLDHLYVKYNLKYLYQEFPMYCENIEYLYNLGFNWNERIWLDCAYRNVMERSDGTIVFNDISCYKWFPPIKECKDSLYEIE